MVKDKTKNTNKSQTLIQITKATILAVTLSLLMLLVFALFIRFVNISEKVILPVNQVIKIISLFIACFVALKNTNKGFLKGLIIGILYAIISYIVFSFLSGAISFGLTSFTDILFCGVIGGICGILAVNTRKRNN